MKRYVKLSPRLQQLVNMVSKTYDHIWDTCCDHGLLGEALLHQLETNENSASTIHFVDIVPELMFELEQRLSKRLPGRAPLDAEEHEHGFGWEVRCQDVIDLDLSEFPDDHTHLVIIAGVGGELAIEIVKKITARLSNLQQKQIEFLLCPVYHQYKVRTSMHALGLRLEREVLLKDGKHFYEVLHVSFSSSHKISPIGERMWDLSNPDHSQYLKKKLSHYQGVMIRQPDAKEIYSCYKHLLESLS
jgi:tRNA (adenine22-N1)-methyltransferase